MAASLWKYDQTVALSERFMCLFEKILKINLLFDCICLVNVTEYSTVFFDFQLDIWVHLFHLESSLMLDLNLWSYSHLAKNRILSLNPMPLNRLNDSLSFLFRYILISLDTDHPVRILQKSTNYLLPKGDSSRDTFNLPFKADHEVLDEWRGTIPSMTKLRWLA